jgi:regulation of enolase protein 1 (concanavalin A-like superfamily)
MTMLRALRAEWTKFWSVRSTGLALLAMVLLSLGISTLGAWLSRTDVYEHPFTYDQCHLVHQPMTGDGTLTARVVSQKNTAAWAKAGIMVKASTTAGAPYVALMVTPAHGVRLIADATTELVGTGPAAPRWLRLTRAGQTFTGAESADGSSWRTVGTVTVPDLPAEALAGLFVATPPTDVQISVQGRSGSISRYLQLGEAVFDHVSVGTAVPATAAWQDADVNPPPPRRGVPEPGPEGIIVVDLPPGSSTRDSAGTVTVTGAGELGRIGVGGTTLLGGGAFDRVRQRLVGAQLGIIGAIVLGILFVTSEYRTGTIGITFAASPRRRYVLAAKTAVLAGVVFVVGLLPGFAISLYAPAIERHNGYRPPVFPDPPPFTDPVVLRAIVGTAAFLALIAVFSLAVGAILRGTAAATTLLLTLLVVIPTVATGTSDTADHWIRQATPFAGLSIQQTLDVPSETVTGPWTGFAVLCAYTVAALAAGFWFLRRRDA